MDYFKNLYKKHKQFALIEWAYAILTLITLLIVGLVNLINPSVGESLLVVPFACFVIFATNLVAWSLIKTFVDYLDTRATEMAEKVMAEKTKKTEKAEKVEKPKKDKK